MEMLKNSSVWWGAPKKFTGKVIDRKVSWLELFYDLVYVIAIAKITHHLALHFTPAGFINYLYLFGIIYWGWLNGSLYHDLHGTDGLRTKLLMLWQMIIVAGISVALGSSPEFIILYTTLTFMVMQLYIAYMWWSAGYYFKEHLKYDLPYVICYVIAFFLLFASLFVEENIRTILIFISLFFNYLPPFIIHKKIKESDLEFELSESMTERLGLFTIIIYGEVILGIIDGVGALERISGSDLLNFGLSIIFIFSLWWIFFTVIADRKIKSGILDSTLLELLYIPSLMALSVIGIAFSDLLAVSTPHQNNHGLNLLKAFPIAISVYLLCLSLALKFVSFDSGYQSFKKWVQKIFSIASALFLILAFLPFHFSFITYLLIATILIFIVILTLNIGWYKITLERAEIQNKD